MPPPASRRLLLATAAVALPLFAPLLPAQTAPPNLGFLLVDRPVSSGEVKVGVSAAKTGRFAAVGSEQLRGARVFFDRLNAKEGGIHGRKVKLLDLDDRLEPLPCVLNTRRLINEEKVFALLCYNGAVNTRAASRMIAEAQVPLIGTFSGAQNLRQPINRFLFHVRPGYLEEAALIVERLSLDRNATKIAVFAPADADGEAMRRAIERALQPRGTSLAASVTYVRNTLDLSSAIDSLASTRPDALVLGGAPTACATLLKGLHGRGVNPLVVGFSFVGAEAFAEAAGSDAEGVFLTQVVPSPNDGSARVVAAYQQDFRDAGEPVFSHASLEGYINAMALAEGLRAAGPSLSVPSFMKAMESLSMELGGQAVTFTPSTRQGLKQVYLTSVRGGRVVSVTSLKPEAAPAKP